MVTYCGASFELLWNNCWYQQCNQSVFSLLSLPNSSFTVLGITRFIEFELVIFRLRISVILFLRHLGHLPHSYIKTRLKHFIHSSIFLTEMTRFFLVIAKTLRSVAEKEQIFTTLVIGPSRKEAITAVNIALQSFQFLNFEKLLRKVSELQLFREKSLWKVLNSCIGLYWSNHLPVWMRFFLVVYFPIWTRKEISKVVLLWSVLSWVVWWKWYLENCWLSTLELVFPVH